MSVKIPMLDAMHVPTYAKYLKDILNQKRSIPRMDKHFIGVFCISKLLGGEDCAIQF
jgi:hypothetical protein